MVSLFILLDNFHDSFTGCYFHGCRTCSLSLTKKQLNQMKKWEAKERHLQSKGVELRVMKSCQWKQIIKTIKNTKTRMPRILKTDTEESLLQSILTDEIFGFALCSVATNPNEISKMEEVLWHHHLILLSLYLSVVFFFPRLFKGLKLIFPKQVAQ